MSCPHPAQVEQSAEAQRRALAWGEQAAKLEGNVRAELEATKAGQHPSWSSLLIPITAVAAAIHCRSVLLASASTVEG